MESLDTAVALLIFNRPEFTSMLFDAVSRVKPRKLFIIADGPRKSVNSDIDNCARVREIVKKINWDCDLKTNYSKNNLGCKKRISSGITWVFEQVKEAIILEDDCLPHPTFFPYCQELLNRYRYDTRIMMISGDNFQFGKKRRNTDSYYFSFHHHIWGWATWKRSWDLYDVDMEYLPELVNQSWLEDLFGNKISAKIWTDIIRASHVKDLNTWDHQWIYSCLINSGLSIAPATNLVRNIGFTLDSTHTKSTNSVLSNISISPMKFPLTHPRFVIRDAIADRNENKFLKTNIITKIKSSIFKSVPHKASHYHEYNRI